MATFRLVAANGVTYVKDTNTGALTNTLTGQVVTGTGQEAATTEKLRSPWLMIGALVLLVAVVWYFFFRS